MWDNIVWKQVEQDKNIELLEHPIFNTFINKKEYYEEFGKILDQLDGQTMTDYVSFFFKKNVIVSNCLVFYGENERMDFYDWAVELGCIPELTELKEGESTTDKQKRDKEDEKLRAQKIQKEKKMEKKNSLTEYDKDLKMLKSKLEGYYRLLDSSKGTPEKIKRSIDMIEAEYNKFKVKYGELDVFENVLKNMKNS
tara:strand:+ start:695 stop:1282 length:588 start_codon:yes stop_codon:yes gene_type:complete